MNIHLDSLVNVSVSRILRIEFWGCAKCVIDFGKVTLPYEELMTVLTKYDVIVLPLLSLNIYYLYLSPIPHSWTLFPYVLP